jgi:hypothetical protein
LSARDDVNASTPPIGLVRIVLSLAASKGSVRLVALHDASVAFFHADIDEYIVVMPPPGLRKPGRVWQLRKALYGTRRASQLWQEYLANMFLANGWERIAVCAGGYYHPKLDMTSVVHGDDFATEGEPAALDVLDEMLEESVMIKKLGRIGPGGDASGRYLKRTIEWRAGQFVWKGDEKHVWAAAAALGFDSTTKPAETPGTKTTGATMRNALDLLDEKGASLVASVGGTVNFIAIDRPECQYASKCVMAEIGAPTQLTLARLKRLVRFLIGAPVLEWYYPVQALPREVLVETDSDWAEDAVTRRSTSCIMLYHGKHLVESVSSTQSVIALSSGEAELIAICRGAASALLATQFLRQCGVKTTAVVATDSNAGRAMATRIGSGKVRHLDIKHLWVQERVRAAELHVTRVPTEENTADIGTKYLDAARINKLLRIAGLRLSKGLASSSGGSSSGG